MSIITYTVAPDGLHIQTADARLLLTPYTPQTIRVRCTAQAEFGTRRSFMVVAEPEPDAASTES